MQIEPLPISIILCVMIKINILNNAIKIIARARYLLINHQQKEFNEENIILRHTMII